MVKDTLDLQQKLQRNWIMVALLVFYFIFHLYNLTALPIFADESIYIRWSQLIIDEPARYLFFPLNDGKTPLFIWTQIPFLNLFSNPVFAGRLVSVLVGAFQVLVMGELAWLLSKSKKARFLAMLLTAILPYWFFHHRMALMDGMMTLFLSISWYSALKLVLRIDTAGSTSLIKYVRDKEFLAWVGLAGLGFGLALWTKLPAILFAAPLLLTALFSFRPRATFQFTALFSKVFGILAALGVGFFFFLLLKVNPAFGQLFARGSDFLYPTSEVLRGAWLQTLPNIPTYIFYLWQYLTWPVILLALIGLFSPHQKRTYHLLFWSAVLFLLPIALLGKVVYPRYLLPIALPLTLAASLMLAELVEHWVNLQSNFKVKLAASVVIVTLVGGIVNQSSLFMIPALVDPNQIPFVPADQVQYQTEWSSGHGIVESVEYIQTQAQAHSVAVATEGYFGTLPDAITAYLHNQDVTTIYVEGIGQPVLTIPDSFSNRAQEYDQVLLVVNSHRLQLPLDENLRVRRYCRPFDAPCLEIWDITSLIKP